MRATSRRRARRALLVGLAVVLLAQAGLNLLMETSRPDLRDPEYGCRLHRLRALRRSEPGRPLVVALGSSRTQMGLCPAEFPELPAGGGGAGAVVFNFGLSGCGPLQELLCLNRLLEAGVRPDYLLVEVLPPVLHQDGRGEDFVQLARLAWEDFSVLRPYCSEPDELFRDWCRHRLSPWWAARFALMSRVLPNWLPWQARLDYHWKYIDRFGWLPYPHEKVTAEHRAKQTERARNEYRAHLTNFHISPIPDRALREMLQVCAREGIPVALYVMPEGPAFRGWYPPQATAQIDGYLGTLCAEHGVPLLDARAWLAEEDFCDSHHLLQRGARSFSRRFGRELLAPWLASDPSPPRGPR